MAMHTFVRVLHSVLQVIDRLPRLCAFPSKVRALTIHHASATTNRRAKSPEKITSTSLRVASPLAGAYTLRTPQSTGCTQGRTIRKIAAREAEEKSPPDFAQLFPAVSRKSRTNVSGTRVASSLVDDWTGFRHAQAARPDRNRPRRPDRNRPSRPDRNRPKGRTATGRKAGPEVDL